MSTSLLYHGFRVIGTHYLRTRYEKGQIIFTVKEKPASLRCPVCGSKKVLRKGKVLRQFRTLPIGSHRVGIEMAIPRVKCLSCGIIRQIKLAFADERKHDTRAFEWVVLELSRYMTILDIARHLGVSWDVVKGIQKRYLGKHFSHPWLKDLEQIAIDEISTGKGHQYLTVVLDLKRGAVVFVGEGKGSNVLKPFWKRLKLSGAQIDAVAIDMSPAYISAVTEHLPEAVLIFDRFHIVKLSNDRLSDLRRRLYQTATGVLAKKVLKGSSWLLLKNPENLKEKKGERKRLQEALELNRPLATAYYMKEDLRRFWTQPDKATAEAFLDDWIKRASASKISMLVRFAKTLRKHQRGILAYDDYPISTGPLEGTNNKIKTMKRQACLSGRQAYGFRDKEFFKLKIMAIHNARYALVG